MACVDLHGIEVQGHACIGEKKRVKNHHTRGSFCGPYKIQDSNFWLFVCAWWEDGFRLSPERVPDTRHQKISLRIPVSSQKNPRTYYKVRIQASFLTLFLVRFFPLCIFFHSFFLVFPTHPHTLSPQSAQPQPLPPIFIQGLVSLVLCVCLKIGLGRETFSSENNRTLRGAWRDRDTNDVFAHCSLNFYFLDFKFPTLFVLLNFILWSGSFLKIPSGKRKISEKPSKTPSLPASA